MTISIDIGPWPLALICLTIITVVGIVAWYKDRN